MPVHSVLMGLNGWLWCVQLHPEDNFCFRTVWYMDIMEPVSTTGGERPAFVYDQDGKLT
jgi:hypothetical protein